MSRAIPLIVGLIAGAGLGLGAALVSGDDAPPPSPGMSTEGSRLNAPAEIDAVNRAVPGSVGYQCSPVSQEDASPKDPAFEQPIRAIAITTCVATGNDAAALYVWRFATRSDLRARYAQWGQYFGTVHGACSGFDSGETWWTDPRGVTRGAMTCATRDVTSHVIWSDARHRLVYEASSGTGQEGLNAWWRAHVRRFDRFPPAYEARLRARAARFLDVRDCRRDDVWSSPQALAAIVCVAPRTRAGDRIEEAADVRLAAFARDEQLDAHFERSLSAWLVLATRGPDERGCRDGNPLYTGNWPGGGRQRGRVLCFPAGSYERIAWTDERHRLFGLVTGSDQSVQRATEAWSLLRRVGQ